MLAERAQRQRETDGYRDPSGSEEVQTVRSRSDGDWSEEGPKESEGVQGGPSRSIKIGQGEIRLGRMSSCTCAKRYPRSEPFDQNQTEGIRQGKQTAAGGAAPLCGGEVTGVEAGAS